MTTNESPNELTTKTASLPSVSDLTQHIPEVAALFELGRLSPKVAIDAAVALLESENPLFRHAAVHLGAQIVSAQGSKPTRCDALVSFMARMLGGDWNAATDFMAHAESATRKLAGKLCALLAPDRVLALERAYPGFVKNLSAQALYRMPEVAGMLRADGLIDSLKLFDIHCVAGLNHYIASSQHPEFSERQAHGLSLGLPNSTFNIKNLRDIEESMARASDFLVKVEAAYPGWSKEFWQTFWNLSYKSATAAQKVSSGAFSITLTTTVDGFTEVPDFCAMDALRLNRLALLVRNAVQNPSYALFSKFGACMAKASDAHVLALSSLEGGLQNHQWALRMSNLSPLYWQPVNSTARVLFWLPEGDLIHDRVSGLAAMRADAWMALAESLRAGGAPPPVFALAGRTSTSTRAGDRSAFAHKKGSWPCGLLASLAPAMFLSKFGYPASSPVFDWLVSSSAPEEIPAIRSWLSAAGHNSPEKSSYETFLDAIEIRASTPNATIGSTPGSRPRL